MDDRTLIKQATHDHEMLDCEVDELLRTLNADAAESMVHWFARCFAGFRHFHTRLRKHMEFEEDDGFMMPVRARRPTLSRCIEELLREHRAMITDCIEIERFLNEASDPTGEDREAVRLRIRTLLGILRRHEQAENKLVQEVFNSELGAGD